MRRSPGLVLAVFAFGQLSWTQPTMFPPVRGTREMVAAANNFEVEAGYRMLMQGGNAVDAGVAAILAAACNRAGAFRTRRRNAAADQDGRQACDRDQRRRHGAGKRATSRSIQHDQWSLGNEPDRMPPIPTQGIRAAILPGVFDGLIAGAEKSTAPSRSPGVRRRPSSTPMDSRIGEEFAAIHPQRDKRSLELWPASTAFFLPAGAPPSRGEIFREPTLRQNAA